MQNLLDFKHPITNEDMHLEAKIPQYFEEVLEELKEREKEY